MKRILFLFLCFLLAPNIHAQKEDGLDRILDDFAAYSELPREVAYVHLNKSVFIKGENIGFKAYVLDKSTRRPSEETGNLYCVLLDSNLQVVKSRLIRIENGVGHGQMGLDSVFHTGKYTFRAFTNWMRNFSETNYFEQSLDILDPETDRYLPLRPATTDVLAQFLPEGGHVVAGIETVFGVVIKDLNGFGIPGLEGRITDPSGVEHTRFKLNRFGIGRFMLLPEEGKTYFAHFRYADSVHRVALTPVQPEGIGMKLTDLPNRVALRLQASGSFAQGKKDRYFLTIHNGDSIKGVPVSFQESDEVIKVFPKEDLYPGINVFNLFTPLGEPMLERLFFNFNDLNLAHTAGVQSSRALADSLEIQISLEDMDPAHFQSLSVSILPSMSKSYGAHHNLPSYTLLKPYIKGAIQDGGYYFRDTDGKKRYELDNLLLTQGWSSYDWTTVMNHPPEYRFDFEKGIAFKVHFNKRESDEFYMFPSSNHTAQLLKMKEGETTFQVEEFFPLEGENLGLSEIRSNGMTRPSGMFVQFKPSKVPDPGFKASGVLANKLGNIFREVASLPISFENLEKLQQLDEVVVTKKRRRDRLEKLQDRSTGRVDVFELNDPRRNQFLANYLEGRGFYVNETLGQVVIVARVPNTPNNPVPVIYLDGILLTSFDILYRFRLDIVDYIEINQAGIGNGLFGGGGVIRIVTDPTLPGRQATTRRVYNNVPIPLAFGRKKKFYTPVYPSYSSEFFQTFGTIDWLPDLRCDADGTVRFKIRDYGLEQLDLHLEGITNGTHILSTTLRLQRASD